MCYLDGVRRNAAGEIMILSRAGRGHGVCSAIPDRVGHLLQLQQLVPVGGWE